VGWWAARDPHDGHPEAGQGSGRKEPHKGGNPDEVVANRSRISGRRRQGVRTLLLPTGRRWWLGIETLGGVIHHRSDRNTTIPRARPRSLERCGQTELESRCTFSQGSARGRAGQTAQSESSTMVGIPRRPAAAAVAPWPRHRRQCIVHVSQRSRHGKERTFTITASSGLNDKDIERNGHGGGRICHRSRGRSGASRSRPQQASTAWSTRPRRLR